MNRQCNENFVVQKSNRKKNTPEKKIHCWNQGRKKCREKKQRKCLYFISGFKLNALLFFFRIFASVSVCLPYILKIQRNRDKENKPTALNLWSSRRFFLPRLYHVTISSEQFHFACSFYHSIQHIAMSSSQIENSIFTAFFRLSRLNKSLNVPLSIAFNAHLHFLLPFLI